MSQVFPASDLPDDPMRFTTMALCSSGPSTFQRQKRAAATRDSVNVRDIPGAAPKTSKVPTNRPTFHDPTDVPGTQPKTLHPTLNKKSTVCYNGDIEGSRPKPATFATRRVVNPLAPQYSLPRVPVRTEETPSLTVGRKAPLRDTMSTADIPGTAPTPYHKFATRDSHNVKDIDGAHPDWQPHHKSLLSGATRDIMSVADINGGRFKTKRVTDPLMPTHVINGMRVTDDDPKMKPKPLPKARAGPYLSLTTGDIEGADGSYKPKHTTPGGITEDQRRQFRQTNNVDDIPGAKADSLQRSMRTKRVTDPNAREYPSLDGAVHHVPERLLHKPMDPRDDELLRLRSEVEALRKDAEIMRLEKELAEARRAVDSGDAAAGRSRPPRPASTRPAPERDIAPVSSGMRSSRSTPSLHTSMPATSARSALRSSASRPSLPSARSSMRSSYGRGAGSGAGAGADVLRLGTPGSARSRMTTARSSASRTPSSRPQDVSEVASLPDTFPSRALHSAGSKALMG